MMKKLWYLFVYYFFTFKVYAVVQYIHMPHKGRGPQDKRLHYIFTLKYFANKLCKLYNLRYSVNCYKDNQGNLLYKKTKDDLVGHTHQNVNKQIL